MCEVLNLLPAKPNGGLQDPLLSSWGGSVLHNATDNTWHMYASLIEHGCGLAAWRPNSALGHATSTAGPDGPCLTTPSTQVFLTDNLLVEDTGGSHRPP